MPGLAILGEQRGDEGKGRYVDMYMPEFDIGARFNGGDNAGHTVVVGEEEFNLHGLPTSVLHPHATSVMGNGVVINPLRLTKEIENLEDKGIDVTPDNLLISSSAHLILPGHISEDEIREAGKGRQGSTKSGIAPTYGEKAWRTGLRAEDISNNPDKIGRVVLNMLIGQKEKRRQLGLDPINEQAATQLYVESAKKLGKYVTDTALFLNRELRKDKPANLLAEGAQAFLLDIDHGMYPYVTSSSTTIGGVITGLGIAPRFIDRTLGVVKAVQSHVGGGPFVTEISDTAMLANLHGKDPNAVDAERGTTTGRVRRLGHLDLAQVKRAQMINYSDEMALTKLDWVPRFGEVVQICTRYERKGKPYQKAPDAGYKLEQSTPHYEPLPTWSEDIQGVRSFSELPKTAQDYIEFIENETGVPITLIGVGPERDQVIVRS